MNNDLIKQYRIWVDPHYTIDYISEDGSRLPFYPFEAWAEFISPYDPNELRKKGKRAKAYYEYKIFCIENGYLPECPKVLGIEYLV